MAREHCLWRNVRYFVRDFISQHVWQYVPLYDFDDLYQEAFLVFAKVRDKYKNLVNSHRHFYVLFRESLKHRFLNLRRRARRSMAKYHLADAAEQIHDKHRFEDKVRESLLDAPDLVRKALARIGVLDSYHGRKFLRTIHSNKESIEMYVRRITGCKDKDVLDKVVQWASN